VPDGTPDEQVGPDKHVGERGGWGFIGILTALTALGHFASAIYLPSLPALAEALQASPAAAHATLSVFLLGFAAAQLAYGPLSDQFGRRRVLFWGLAVFVLASVACALAPDIETLIAARLAQGMGACAGMVIARAIARDCYSGKALSVAMATIATAIAVVPGFVPLLGGVLQDGLGWRAAFVATAAVGLAVAMVAYFRLPESNKASTSGTVSMSRMSRDYGDVLRSSVFRRNAVTMAFGMAAMFAFNAASPALFIERLGTSATEYGIYPTITVAGYFLGAAAAARLVRRIAETKLILVGTLIMALGTGLMLLLPIIGQLSVWGMVAAMFVFVGGLGIVMPLGSAAALQPFRHCAGTASAVLGFVQMGGAAAGSAIVGLVPGLGDTSLGATMAMFSLAAIVWYWRPLGALRAAPNVGPASERSGDGLHVLQQTRR